MNKTNITLKKLRNLAPAIEDAAAVLSEAGGSDAIERATVVGLTSDGTSSSPVDASAAEMPDIVAQSLDLIDR